VIGRLGLWASLFALGATGCAAQTGPSALAGATAPAPHRYLSDPQVQALADGVPDAAIEGSAQGLIDITASDRFRALEDSDRWMLATRQAELRPALALSHFDCALGFRIASSEAPHLVALLDGVLQDANAAAELAKARAYRPRPVAVDPDRRACVVLTPAGRASASYPSGSAAVGAAYGEVYAALDPRTADATREIGRQIGISRMVCAMHYPADVREGAALGRAVFQAIASTPGFQADLAQARAELASARDVGATSPSCAAERLALATPLP